MARQTQKKKPAANGNNRFSALFFAQTAGADLKAWAQRDLDAVANSIKALSAARKPGRDLVRVYNPEMKRDGFHFLHTAIELINDDTPFIVDSIVAELHFQGLTVDSIFHPVLSVQRDKAGNALDFADEKSGGAGYVMESYIFIRLEQVLSAEACRKLEERLRGTLKDVRAATSDWQAMLKKMDHLILNENEWGAGRNSDDRREARDFFSYLKNNNFTFLGYRAYDFGGKSSKPVKGSGLGVLREDHDDLPFGQGANAPEIGALKLAKWPLMITKLTDHHATVHRRVPMDAICIKSFDKKGELAGMHLFVGLFTSSTYSCRTSDIPIVRLMVSDMIRRAGFTKASHDAKALEHTLEKIPRDELFQLSNDDLYDLAMGIMSLKNKQRIALFTHLDPLRQHLSCLVYTPRDRYNSSFLRRAKQIVENGVRGSVKNAQTTLDDSPLARILFTVDLEVDIKDAYDHAALESQITDIGREWDEKLRNVLTGAFGKLKGAELASVYARAFTAGYQESIHIDNAAHDIRQLESLRHGSENICIDLYRLQGAEPGDLRLKVYHRQSPVPLADILPMLENLGLRAIAEVPHEVKPQGDAGAIWIHDFQLKGLSSINLEKSKANFEEIFLEVWNGRAENDGLNQLALNAGLNWAEIRMLRTYSGYMRQARFPYSRTYVEQVLNSYPDIATALVDLFKALHDPKTAAQAARNGKVVGDKIIEMLQTVQKLDHDRILRAFKTLIEKTLRASYYQRDENGQHKSYLAIKLDSKNIAELPLPRPNVEIYVYSSRVEAVHLRGGEIARGGIRWSDRHEDFRTEILGLLKSQTVKNTVIVPVGAKGGFVVKQPPKAPPGEAGKSFNAREAYQQEGIECYKIFVRAMLDLTDNDVKGKIIRPKNVVCHDAVDPYLVVAADKGTATFSDIANGLSQEAGFWLNDAFASGGGTGYDHKKMAITARGGWESVKRHFREIGKDIQKEPFTVVGVGDMAGDVFGNAMLLSKQILLQGAFNHVHIFCDPTPDAEKSFAERSRMFKARGGWDTYNKDLLSPGGAVFDRSAKVLKLSPQIRKCFNIDQDQVTPDDLMRAILKANVELVWFGGIGTFVKSSRQSNADADDKSNDSVRIDGREIRAKVVGEGANLGTTQLSRVEYARHGGRLNTDFIDNSAGVDCSDHEVNIKILLSGVMAKGKMTLPQRNKLLEQMTQEVAELVLTDNYQQSQALSLQLYRAKDDLALHANLIRELERSGALKRSLEGLPDDEGFARMAKEGEGLTRPELAVLTSYAKMTIYNDILASDIPDDPATQDLLVSYFPKALQKYGAEIKAHRLKREIIATQVVNILVNRMGAVFVQSRMAKTGKSATEVVKAFLVVMRAYELPALWRTIEALDNKVPSDVQLSALHETYLTVKRSVTWFLRFTGAKLDISEEVADFGPGIAQLRKIVRQIAPPETAAKISEQQEKLVVAGMPEAIAEEIAVIKFLSSAGDIVHLSRHSKGDIRKVAAAYFETGETLGLDWLRQQAAAIVPSSSWQARVIGGLNDDFYAQQAALTAASLSRKDRKAPDNIAKIVSLVGEMKAQAKVELEMLVVAAQRIGLMLK